MRTPVLAMLLLFACGESVAHEPFEIADEAYDLNATPIVISVYLATELEAQLRNEGRHVAKLRTSFNITGSDVFAPTVKIDPDREIVEDVGPEDLRVKGSGQTTHVTRLVGLPSGRLNVRIAAFDAAGQQVGIACYPTTGQNSSIRPRSSPGEKAAVVALSLDIGGRADCPVPR